MDMIVAHANNRAIGKGNSLPWKVPADMCFFVSKTLEAKDLLVGKNTLLSIPNGKLPERNLFVLSSTHNKLHTEVVLRTVEEALELDKHKPLMVIGGQSIYETFLPYTENLFVTSLELDVVGADTFFPEYNNQFSFYNEIEKGCSNKVNYRIEHWKRSA
jgi:dihydrofolate reductase